MDATAVSVLAGLRARAREIALLESCLNLLEWDEETTMPRGGAEHRGTQAALLAGLVHERLQDPAVNDALGTVAGAALAPADAVLVQDLRRRHRRARCVPRQLVEEQRRVFPLAQQAWADARAARSFSDFAPWLERIVHLKRDEGQSLLADGSWAEAGSLRSPYDGLLAEHEPGVTTDEIQALFEALEAPLGALVQRLATLPRRGDAALLHRVANLDRQRALVEALAVAVGFSFDDGRIDTAVHPSCSTVGPNDVRIATRFDPDDVTEGIYSTLHELGHALYEQGLPTADALLPAGTVRSLSLHEGQARLWENAVGRSRPFVAFLHRLLRQLLPSTFDDLDEEALWRAVNTVTPSWNRVRADEATYNLHILVRFDIERRLIEGSLSVHDVQDAWNEGYRRTLGVIPEDDAQGVLQDGHWSAGLFGYFPTYMLGNLVAAQLFAAACRALPSWVDDFARGEFAGFLGWLRTHVHGRGGIVGMKELVADATGAPLASASFLSHLEQTASALGGA